MILTDLHTHTKHTHTHTQTHSLQTANVGTALARKALEGADVGAGDAGLSHQEGHGAHSAVAVVDSTAPRASDNARSAGACRAFRGVACDGGNAPDLVLCVCVCVCVCVGVGVCL